ncbi:hypothetical protein QE152_g39771 [Popillia japonica]|uniref:Uncharacterized protein n=1 Tax=Popillia japonica TaxID=7064 RepID=A0AAW1HT77_POPJA
MPIHGNPRQQLKDGLPITVTGFAVGNDEFENISPENLDTATGLTDFEISTPTPEHTGVGLNLVNYNSSVRPPLPATATYSKPLNLGTLKLNVLLKIPRRRWTSPERQAVKDFFGDYFKEEKLPSYNMCVEARNPYPQLSSRSPNQIKAFVNNEINRFIRLKGITKPSRALFK